LPKKGEKTEKATPRRLKKARQRGQVARSREVSSALVLGAALIYFYAAGSSFISSVAGEVRMGLEGLSSAGVLTPGSALVLFRAVISRYAAIVVPPMVLVAFMAIGGNLAQGGFVLSSYPLKPKLDRLNPLKGFARIFGSLRTLAQTATSSLKLVIVALIGYLTIKPELANIASIYHQSAGGTIVYLGWLAFRLLLRVWIFLMLLAILDFFYQKYEYKRSLMMTKREVKDEFKETEGDPLLRRRIRQKQYEMARRRMISEVPKADVVITNPTRIAVALQYLATEAPAPVVVAKGAGAIAQKIISLATESGVPIVENRPLAALLFNTVEVGQVIPETLYRAVAEVLAYVYRLGNRMAQAAKRVKRSKHASSPTEATTQWA